MTLTDAHRLGSGWPFPPRPEVTTNAIGWLSGAPHVRQSILLVLDTEPGERVMLPEFGCGLRRYLMEPNTPATRAAIAREVEGSLRRWEPRIELRPVVVSPTDDPATVLLVIDYRHLRDLVDDTLEVPFTFEPARGV